MSKNFKKGIFSCIITGLLSGALCFLTGYNAGVDDELGDEDERREKMNKMVDECYENIENKVKKLREED